MSAKAYERINNYPVRIEVLKDFKEVQKEARYKSVENITMQDFLSDVIELGLKAYVEANKLEYYELLNNHSALAE